MVLDINFFNKVINELLTVDVKINKKDKALIFLSSLPQSYKYIITTMLYDKETFILEEVTATLLSNEIRKRPNQVEQERSGLVAMGRKGREGKKSLVSSNVCHFYHKKGHWKNDCKHLQEWLKKKGQVMEADVTMSDVDIKVLMAFYVEDKTSQGKCWIFDSGSTIHVYSRKEIFQLLSCKRGRDC